MIDEHNKHSGAKADSEKVKLFHEIKVVARWCEDAKKHLQNDETRNRAIESIKQEISHITNTYKSHLKQNGISEPEQ
ncbi:MAG: hypothetical protein FWE16_03210 [Firmicutes bacterium]|nr:hypothetical protein [Bacillota bacterium]